MGTRPTSPQLAGFPGFALGSQPVRPALPGLLGEQGGDAGLGRGAAGLGRAGLSRSLQQAGEEEMGWRNCVQVCTTEGQASEGVEAACPAREEKEALWVAVMPV